MQTIEKRQGLKIACLEEIAYKKGWIEEEDLLSQAHFLSNTDYGDYLKQILNEDQ